MSCDYINQLPKNVLLEIVSKLNVRDALVCSSGVCSVWNELLNSGGGIGSVVNISSVKFAFFWKRESEEYQISCAVFLVFCVVFVCSIQNPNGSQNITAQNVLCL